ncbi:MAG TPA: hypothetical protein VK498_00490, partial [Ferruginibacter sp.]|nr:hypothetical protein [Ferruginibacter sp.]
MKIIGSLIFLIVIYVRGYSQQIDLLINQYGKEFPQEKIHIHTDKEIYFNKETIWFKAYLLADLFPSTTSTNFFVELWDGSGKLLDKKIAPVWNASAIGELSFPDTLQTQDLFIRAYTTWMLNFDRAFIYYKKVRLISHVSPEEVVSLKSSLALFPEGGNLVPGIENQVAFKAINNNGTPFNVEGTLKNDKGVIQTIKSLHNGMGVFTFIPQNEVDYYIEWKDINGMEQKTFLPAEIKNAIVLHVEQGDNVIKYVVRNSNPGLFSQLTVIGSMYQKAVYKSIIDMPGQSEVSKKFAVHTLPTGILQLTVFDQNNKPMAERIVFINNHNYSFNASVTFKEKNTNSRGQNIIEIEVPDSIKSNLSLSVFDAGLPFEEYAANIYSSLLLSADLKGTIHQPGWYFEKGDPLRMKYLDLVMQTNGWRKYNWEKLIAAKLPEIKYPRENFLSISGRVTNKKGEPMVNNEIYLIVSKKDSTEDIYSAFTNNYGIFTRDTLIFFDTATLFYRMAVPRENLLVTLNTHSHTIIPTVFNNNLISRQGGYKNLFYLKEIMPGLYNYDSEFEKKNKRLKEVVLRSKRNIKNEQLNKLEDQYANGIFRSAGLQIDVLHDSTAGNFYDVYSYLANKIPSLRVNNTADS